MDINLSEQFRDKASLSVLQFSKIAIPIMKSSTLIKMPELLQEVITFPEMQCTNVAIPEMTSREQIRISEQLHDKVPFPELQCSNIAILKMLLGTPRSIPEMSCQFWYCKYVKCSFPVM